jgi:hypothetical protein
MSKTTVYVVLVRNDVEILGVFASRIAAIKASYNCFHSKKGFIPDEWSSKMEKEIEDLVEEGYFQIHKRVIQK